MVVEGQVDDQAFQPRISSLELADAADLVDPEVSEPLLPDVERGLGDAELPATSGAAVTASARRSACATRLASGCTELREGRLTVTEQENRYLAHRAQTAQPAAT